MNGLTYLLETRRTRPDKGNPLLQGALGISSEAGEVTGLLEKHLCQGHELDREKLKKELGDVLWYMAMLLDATDTSFEEVMEANIAKLRARYPEKFSTRDSVRRVDEK
jgi:NTP pyrophosphatase (non-canonical NTP hydrolase)